MSRDYWCADNEKLKFTAGVGLVFILFVIFFGPQANSSIRPPEVSNCLLKVLF